MQEQSDKLPPHLQQLVEAGVTGIDIMHGMLKMDMLEAEARYTEAQKIEEENDGKETGTTRGDYEDGRFHAGTEGIADRRYCSIISTIGIEFRFK